MKFILICIFYKILLPFYCYCRVSETSTEIVRQLTLRASTPNSYGSSNLLQSQDDVSRVQALLQLQSQRQVLQSRRVLTLPDLLSHCRGAGISEVRTNVSLFILYILILKFHIMNLGAD